MPEEVLHLNTLRVDLTCSTFGTCYTAWRSNRTTRHLGRIAHRLKMWLIPASAPLANNPCPFSNTRRLAWQPHMVFPSFTPQCLMRLNNNKYLVSLPFFCFSVLL